MTLKELYQVSCPHRVVGGQQTLSKLQKNTHTQQVQNKNTVKHVPFREVENDDADADAAADDDDYFISILTKGCEFELTPPRSCPTEDSCDYSKDASARFFGRRPGFPSG